MAELPQFSTAELPHIPTAEQNIPAASTRSSAIPIPSNSIASHSHGPALTSSWPNVYVNSTQQDNNSTQAENLYDEITCTRSVCRLERVDTMQREATETVESMLYRSTEELRAELESDDFNIYDSPT